MGGHRVADRLVEGEGRLVEALDVEGHRGRSPGRGLGLGGGHEGAAVADALGLGVDAEQIAVGGDPRRRVGVPRGVDAPDHDVADQAAVVRDQERDRRIGELLAQAHRDLGWRRIAVTVGQGGDVEPVDLLDDLHEPRGVGDRGASDHDAPISRPRGGS